MSTSEALSSTSEALPQVLPASTTPFNSKKRKVDWEAPCAVEEVSDEKQQEKEDSPEEEELPEEELPEEEGDEDQQDEKEESTSGSDYDACSIETIVIRGRRQAHADAYHRGRFFNKMPAYDPKGVHSRDKYVFIQAHFDRAQRNNLVQVGWEQWNSLPSGTRAYYTRPYMDFLNLLKADSQTDSVLKGISGLWQIVNRYLGDREVRAVYLGKNSKAREGRYVDSCLAQHPEQEGRYLKYGRDGSRAMADSAGAVRFFVSGPSDDCRYYVKAKVGLPTLGMNQHRKFVRTGVDGVVNYQHFHDSADESYSEAFGGSLF